MELLSDSEIRAELVTSDLHLSDTLLGSGMAFDEIGKELYIGGGCTLDRNTESTKDIIKVNIITGKVEKLGEYKTYLEMDSKMYFKEIDGKLKLVTLGESKLKRTTSLDFHIFDLEDRTLEIRKVKNFRNMVPTRWGPGYSCFRQGFALLESGDKEESFIKFFSSYQTRNEDFRNVFIKIDLNDMNIVEIRKDFEYEKGKCSSLGCVIGDFYYNWYGDKKNNSYLVKIDSRNLEKKWELVSERKFSHLTLSRSFSHGKRYFVFLPGIDFQNNERGDYYNPFGNFKETMIHILDLSTSKWKDVKILSDLWIVRCYPNCCMGDGSLYFGSGIIELKDENEVFNEKYFKDLFAIKLFENEDQKQNELDTICRIDFLMNLEEDIRGEAFYVNLKIQNNIELFTFPKIFLL